MFVSAAGMSKQTLHLPYKGGAPAMVATMSNETQFYLGPIPGMVPQIQAGKVRAIAITGDKRSASLPDVPTLKELGLAGAESSGWFGPLAPAGTPQPIIDRLHKAVVETTKDADVLKGLAAQGVEPLTNTPAEFAAYIADTLARYRKVVKAEGIEFK
jgi:tripartite-type tricarboxylate transporter receptor subunit TctC